ncbi:MAG: D-aminoacyl-tRNA deacylase [Sutterellaceae bacterium]|nr:D-aminoacyl-tRNA deacylase [Sutterellaceae bacterium]
MIALLQRVTEAKVTVDGKTIGEIGQGLMVLVCAVKGDTPEKARHLASRLLRYRVFTDEAGKMNKSVTDIGGELLLVSQFTLAADTNSGNRPSFSPAASPEDGLARFNEFVEACRESGLKVQTGEFGAHMKVSLTNDGPVTFWLEN